jgi:hypothetical protein
LEAARKNKWKIIDAVVIDDGIDAELAEIDENLIRADLSPAERKTHIGRRKELYEAKHPETTHGGSRSKNEILKTPAFIDDTAKKTGRGRSTIARDVKHAERVAVLGEIPGTSLDCDSEIEALSKLPIEGQAKAGADVTAKPALSDEAKTARRVAAKAEANAFLGKIIKPAPTTPPNIGMLLLWLHTALKDPKTDVEAGIAEAGGNVSVREIIQWLQAALDIYNGETSVKSAADRAEPKKSPARPTPATDDLGIPTFLRRGAAAEEAKRDNDEEAAEIAAQASCDRKWLDS